MYGLTSRRIMYYLQAFKILALGYWRSEQKWKAYGILAVVLILNLASVFLTVLVNDWYKEFWDVLQAYEFDSFWYLVGKFSLIGRYLYSDWRLFCVFTTIIADKMA